MGSTHISYESQSLHNTVTMAWQQDEITRAREEVEGLFKNSLLHDRIPNLPKFTEDEVLLGKVLGEGAFGTVREIRRIFNESSITQPASVEVGNREHDGCSKARELVAETCSTRYAMKHLKRNVIEDRRLYRRGVANIAIGKSPLPPFLW